VRRWRHPRVPQARGPGRRRYVDPAGGRETVSRGPVGGPGSLRRRGDGMSSGPKGAADRAISTAAVDPIRPTERAQRREATPRQGSSSRKQYCAAPGGAALPRCRGARTRPVDLVVTQPMAVRLRRAGEQSRPARPTPLKGWGALSFKRSRFRQPGCRRQAGAGRLRQPKESLLSGG